MYCPKCGQENPDNAQLCRSCNAVLSSTARPPGPDAKTSGLAIAALILGILGPLTCITILPALILGIVALVKISNSEGRLKGTGLAIAGIAVPFALLPLLMGILMPALARVRQNAFRLICGTNLSGLSKSMILYADYFDDEFPTSSQWCDLLVQNFDVPPETFICRGAPGGPCNYAINKNLENLNIYTAPGDMVLLFETYPGWNQTGGPEILSTENHNGEGCNILFVDGSVEWIDAEDLDRLKWTAASFP